MKYVLILFLTLILPQHSLANSSDLLGKVQKNYAELKGFKANFTQTLFHRESGSLQSRKGILIFAKPTNIYWKTEKPHPETLVINGKEIWNYLPDEEIAYQYGMEMMESSHAILGVITGQSNINDNFEVETITSPPEEVLKGFILFPLEANTQMVEAQTWVNPKTYIIEKVVILDFYGNTNTIMFDDLIKNPKIPAKTFVFKVPTGVLVEKQVN